MTFRPGPPDPWSSVPPHQFGVPQQQGTPNPFGVPGQAYGGPPPYQAPSPYGYGTPAPYGYGMPQPSRNNSKRTALILGGIGGAVILLVVIVMVFVMGTGSSSDERAIKQVFEDIGETGSTSESMQYFCAEDQQMLKKYESSMPESFDADILEAKGRPDSVEITDVKVDGDRATATVTTDGEPDGSAYFRKEDGDWKLCMAEDPKLATRP
ncbi:DUF4878 domain-containing protein [Mycolicibacterium septicum]|uniref:Rv0361 family membrane protein n=1 Tax=Mycolicibacterium septicum TaxID=98668 RepID=UPI00235FE6C1|nr:DUF4878 domain-containing protein [Mycolicibacterium septicum]